MIAKTKQTDSIVDLESPLDRYLRILFAQILAATVRTLKDDDLSLPQVAAMHLIEVRGSMRIGELASELAQPMPATSRFVGDLVDRGLMQRREDPADRRAKVVSLSARGLALVTEMSRRRLEEGTAAMLQVPGAVSERYMDFYNQIIGTTDLARAPKPGGRKP